MGILASLRYSDMDRRDKYQRVEFIDCKNDGQRHHDDFDDDVVCIEHDGEMYPPSPLSSSPPKDFDINIESQYVPIFDEDGDLDQANYGSTSLASSLSNDSAQEGYETSSILLTTNTGRVIRCPVCDKIMRTFYCAKCIQRGHFVGIDTITAERFKESRLKQEKYELSPVCNEMLNDKEKKISLEETLQIKLRTLAKKTEVLKGLLDDQKSRLDQTRKLLSETKSQLDQEKRSNKSKEGKIQLIKRYIISRQASVKKRREAEKILAEDLKQYVKRRIFQLTTDVFPIEEINLLEQSNSFVNMESSPLLTFSDGSHHQIEQLTAYSIVEPWLPSNGDYSSYSLWLNDNQNHITAAMGDLSERNPAFRIGAGLAFATQLVKNLASYLDVILPARLELDTFNNELLDDNKFSYNVAKLNANVIHLCASQGVDVSLMNAQKTLKNLLLMLNLNISDIGRTPIMEIDNEEAASRINNQLSKDLSLLQDDFYDFNKFADDDDDVSDSEWEISDSINPSEAHMATERSIQQNSYISRLPLRLFASFWGTTQTNK